MAKEKTLLEKARGVPTRSRKGISGSPEHLELALAWFYGEVTTKQTAVAFGIKTDSAMSSVLNSFVARLLREACSRGEVEINLKK